MHHDSTASPACWTVPDHANCLRQVLTRMDDKTDRFTAHIIKCCMPYVRGFLVFVAKAFSVIACDD